MNKEALLEQIKADILKNNVCPDLAQEATQLVFGDGNPDAEVVFIGEAPGKNEDLQGMPFVGAAGKFLNEMLASISLERKDIYITNIVKYRPPDNRDPSPSEKEAFLPYLQAQLDVIKPKVVATLGRHSMDSLLPGQIISKVHGQPQGGRITIVESRMKKRSRAGNSKFENLDSTFFAEGKVVILPLYHPAAALYNGSLRATLFEDFAKIPHILKKIN